MIAVYQERPGAHFGPVEDTPYHVALGYLPVAALRALWDEGRWDLVAWDATTLRAAVEGLEDVTCNVVTCNINAGRDEPLERFRPATASLVLYDPEGRYSPWVGEQDPDAPWVTQVGMDLVIWAERDGVVYRRFTGIVTGIKDTFPELGVHHNVTIDAADYLSVLARHEGLEQPPIGAGELTGARISRILMNADYTHEKQLDTGTVTVQATTLEGNSLDQIGLVGDTEAGAVFCNREGVLVFRDHLAMVTDPHYVEVQAIFGDSDAGPDDEICYSDIELAADLDKIKNDVTISNKDGTPVTLVDEASIDKFRLRASYSRTDLIHQDQAQSTAIAQQHLDLYAYATNRIEGLKIDMAALTPEQRTRVLQLGPLYRVQVRRRATGFQVIADLQVQGISEQVDPAAWTMTFKTAAAAKVAAIGLWDVAVWDDGLWGY